MSLHKKISIALWLVAAGTQIKEMTMPGFIIAAAFIAAAITDIVKNREDKESKFEDRISRLEKEWRLLKPGPPPLPKQLKIPYKDRRNL